MKIGELAKRSGCSVQTIRYYEKEGLISAQSPPPRVVRKPA
jgi:DNA-binding transcriptional MerR regulator